MVNGSIKFYFFRTDKKHLRIWSNITVHDSTEAIIFIIFVIFHFARFGRVLTVYLRGMQMRLCPLANESARYNNDKPLSTNENVAFIVVQSPRA